MEQCRTKSLMTDRLVNRIDRVKDRINQHNREVTKLLIELNELNDRIKKIQGR